MKIEIILSEQGSITVEDLPDWGVDEVTKFVQHASAVIQASQPERAQREPYGFGAGTHAQLEISEMIPDPKEVGWIDR